HLLAELRQAVAGRAALHQAAAELLLERRDAPVHGRLAQPQRLGGRERAAVAGDGEEVAQVVPVEHAAVMHFWVTCAQSCGFRTAVRPAHGERRTDGVSAASATRTLRR